MMRPGDVFAHMTIGLGVIVLGWMVAGMGY